MPDSWPAVPRTPCGNVGDGRTTYFRRSAVMRRLILVCSAMLAMAGHASAQSESGSSQTAPVQIQGVSNYNHLRDMSIQFQGLGFWTSIVKANYDASQSADPSLVGKSSPNATEPGWKAGILRGWIVDDITLKVDMTYSRTLQATPGANNVVTPFSLSKVTFVPTYEATWQLPLSKLVPGWRQRDAGRDNASNFDGKTEHVLSRAVELNENTQLAKILGPYGDFEQARNAFIESIETTPNQKPSATCDISTSAGQ